MIKINLGAGDVPHDGYENWDIKSGQKAYPLDVPDDSVDEIRASHILEHFAHGKVADVLRDWVRALRPGGLLRIAVPDLQAIAEQYLAGARFPVQGVLMGGQIDAHDFHCSAFDRESLEQLMRAAGLVAVHLWKSTVQDCASLPISLNMAAWKRPPRPKVACVMSVPRLGFMDNFMACAVALGPLGITPRKFTGAFWGQCLERVIEAERQEAEPPEYILTLDYDTVFSRRDVEDLICLACARLDADAIAPLQAGRGRGNPLFVVRDDKGNMRRHFERTELERTLLRADTAHFGCTLIRTAALDDLPKPWFWSEPDPHGGWGEGRLDDDIFFWRQWAAAGKSLYVAPRVVVGHAQLMISWPDANLEGVVHQYPGDYWENGAPAEAWR